MAHERDSLDTVFDMERLIHPVEVKRFIDEYWEQKPLHIERREPDHYADLLTLDDVDRLLTLAGPSFDTIRVVVDGNETSITEISKRGPLGRTNTLEAIYDHYRQGSTVVLNSLDDRWEPLQQLVQALGAEVSAGFQVNVYLTPAGKARGFKPHYDTHDVLIAQVHGSKQWRLYGAPYELVTRSWSCRRGIAFVGSMLGRSGELPSYGLVLEGGALWQPDCLLAMRLGLPIRSVA
ncbi:JmjC domain-containing protein [Streptomyces sp. NPDC001153]